MEQVKTDLRVIRTRKTIIESFLLLSSKKSFNEISVKDITSEAVINRATFYNHFMDKFDLLEQVISEKLSLNLNCSSHSYSLDLETSLKQIFVSLTSFMQSLQNMAKSQDEKDTIQMILERELTAVFTSLLAQNKLSKDSGTIRKLARLLTHSLIGLSSDYMKDAKETDPQEYVTSLLPFLMNGLND